ncbi:MAG: hypothetical protein K0Q73_3621 [Paenibacillus sp.]|jgi:hypothetical protein|nr:hypothetical protein [Paenibacillus sp.]
MVGVKSISFLLIVSLFTAGCEETAKTNTQNNNVTERSIGNSNKTKSHDDQHNNSGKEQFLNFNDPKAVKETALEGAEFLEALNPEERAFAEKIRPLHFDLKNMALRVSGMAIFHFTGDTNEEGIKIIIDEATKKYNQIENEMKTIQAPDSMNDILRVYLNSVSLFEKSLTSYQSYFVSSNPADLVEYTKTSTKANTTIKDVVFRLWSDEYDLGN